MSIHKEGYVSIAIAVALVIGILWSLKAFNASTIWVVLGVALSVFILVAILQFFRNPVRNTVINPNVAICPADGKVVIIEEVEENEYFKDKRIQVSIFMSPINVHVNRNPVSGKVKFFKYHPGKYLVAWHPKSSLLNERTTVVVENEKGIEILFRQIAGAVARRIVWYVKEEDQVVQGQEFGFIKFGSRVDLFFPVGTKINVELDQVVRGGETVLATFD